MLPLVSDKPELLESLRTFNSFLTAAGSQEGGECRDLVAKGICFVVYGKSPNYRFAPSRFVGYRGNSPSLNRQAGSLHDGGDTNRAIEEILGGPPVLGLYESEYIEYCRQRKIDPKPAFDKPRKYWRLPVDLKTAAPSRRAMAGTVAARIRALRRKPDRLAEDLEAIANSSHTRTEKRRLIQTRLGQGLFRMRVMRQWQFCPVTGCKHSLLLRASHIKPWRDSTNRERLDGFNGLLLAPNVDAAFDRGLLSFDERGRILFSPRLPLSEARRLGIARSVRLKLSARHLPYLAEHRRKHRFPA